MPTRVVSFLRTNWAPLLVALVGTAVMFAFSGLYGMHRDEMYFIIAGRHPSFGYVDQPPLTPLLAAAEVQILGVSAMAVRVLPTLVYGVVVLLSAAIAREFGGGRPAQLVAALTVAVSAWIFVAHFASTETVDILGWMALLLVLVRIFRGGDPRLWLLAGLVAGITLENKTLLVYLVVGLVAGILLAPRFDLLRSKWLWAGAGIALAIWLPNLFWQAAHGWPQLEMARIIAKHSGANNRSSLFLFQLLFAGLFLVPIFLAGLWWLLRSKEFVPWRPIGWAYLVGLVVIYVTKGKGYYNAGLIPVIIAAGSVPAARWLQGGGRALRFAKSATYVGASVLSGLLIVSIALPVVPASRFPTSGLARGNGDAVSTYGWPSFVAQVETVSNQLTPAEREHYAILAGNYGEAGALELLGGPELPPVYSGHNSLWDWGPPDDSRTTTILVTSQSDAGDHFGQWLGPCRLAAKIDLGFPSGITEEQGAGVWVCGPRTASWTAIWSKFRHLD
ncbi:MAG TPA: glycosyltransferase family 39 protein [Acidimicrobiales bacterium]|nr:glycosyltransferase family 39 protein [Acidimicrobiales bacterium]